MMRFILTDEQVIEGVRAWERRRRWVGAVCFVVGLGAIVVMLLVVQDLRIKSLSLLSQLDPSRSPTTQDVQQSFESVQFNLGFRLGFLLSGGLSAGAGLATSGVVWFLARSRKDQLLLKCWDDKPAGP